MRSVTPTPSPLSPSVVASARLGQVFLAAAAFLFVFAAVRTRGVFMDDAYIGFTYVRNLVDGQGLVFSPMQRVEGVTNAGWLLLLAPFSVAAEPHRVARVLGLLLTLASAGLAGAVAAKLCGHRSKEGAGLLSLGVVSLLVIAHADFTYFALTGMEPPLVAVLLCGAALALVGGHSLWGCAALCGAAIAVRPDSVLVFPLFAACAFCARQADARQLARPLAVSTLR